MCALPSRKLIAGQPMRIQLRQLLRRQPDAAGKILSVLESFKPQRQELLQQRRKPRNRLHLPKRLRILRMDEFCWIDFH